MPKVCTDVVRICSAWSAGRESSRDKPRRRAPLVRASTSVRPPSNVWWGNPANLSM